MTTEDAVIATLEEILSLQGRSSQFTRQTQLLGTLPEFDSMAVISVITAIEERFDILIDEDDLEAAIFETVGSLIQFVDSIIAQS